jgi:putative ATP-binding cassette transporter
MKNLFKFLKQAWSFISPYWKSQDWKMAWLLLVVIVSLNLGLVYISVRLSHWSNSFYNSLQNKNFEEFKTLILYFCGWATLYIIGAVYRLYLQQMLTIRWRSWLTDGMLSKWLSNNRFYFLTFADKTTDNPDQRIAEDLRNLCTITLSLGLGLLASVTTLVSFFFILWNLSGELTFNLLGTQITIPGYMVWVAIVYSLFGSIITHLLGKRLVSLNFFQQKVEADFRYSLVRLRENTESISLLGGQNYEELSLKKCFKEIMTNWGSIMRLQKRLTWFTSAYGQLAIIFPIVVAAPRFFSGAIELGALMQISQAFGKVQDSLSWFIDSYGSLAEWKASIDRLSGFTQAMEKSDKLKQSMEDRISKIPSDEVSGVLDISLPNGKQLINSFPFKFLENKDSILVGASGKGKSTLLKVIAGLWPFANGSIRIPKEECVFIPQKSYIPIATLKQALVYPLDAEDLNLDNQFLSKILTNFKLEPLTLKLDEVGDWSKKLSGGELQRIAIIRAILKSPKWLFLDEATSGLDSDTEKLTLALLKQYLPSTTIVAVVHNVENYQGYNTVQM